MILINLNPLECQKYPHFLVSLSANKFFIDKVLRIASPPGMRLAPFQISSFIQTLGQKLAQICEAIFGGPEIQVK